jgi:hypothetical protein
MTDAERRRLEAKLAKAGFKNHKLTLLGKVPAELERRPQGLGKPSGWAQVLRPRTYVH